ncbi:hypothetical protein [Mycoplasma bradburyae]|uniref:Ribbon-helix-helix protein CopG domain-containing protein n=1 Tax=Mycoplasma bradburyae TaxID=2963128 RepID=A0ABT5GBL1_9MOLU|nr:hypothetical protein [Mycoplasma bradburyae]MDC4181830.1 hypothetical protein [Mycoplasma bradburyae]UTS70129.1 hypothetical protein NMG68_03845 [Mycoplasma bradburyae]
MENNKKPKKKEKRFTDLSADLDDDLTEVDPEYEDDKEVKIEKNKDNNLIDPNDPFFYSETYEQTRIDLIKDKRREEKKEEKREPKIEEIKESLVKITNSEYKTEYKPEQKEEKESKDVYIDSSLEIAGQEPLTRGMHFYTNSRVIRKIRECAKSKGLSISRLITMILDKSIKEE